MLKNKVPKLKIERVVGAMTREGLAWALRPHDIPLGTPVHMIKWPKSRPQGYVESIVERLLVREVEKLGGLCEKLKSPARVGWPDRSVFLPYGIHDLIETKRPKGSQWEPLQLHTHDKLRKLGHNVLVINTKEQVHAYIADRKKELDTMRRTASLRASARRRGPVA